MRYLTIAAVIATAAAVGGAGTASADMAWVSTAGNHTRANLPIMVADDNGSGARKVATGSFAVISPDGNRLAFQVSSRFVTGTRVLDVASGVVVPAAAGCMPWTITWSPDSSRFTCSTQTANRKGYVTGEGLSRVDVPASLAGVTTLPLATLIPARGNGFQTVPAPSFSPDGTSLAYAWARWNRPAATYSAPLAGIATRTRLFPAMSSGPVWGPAGTIAVTRETNVRVRIGGSPPFTFPRSQVWLVNPDGSGARRLTSYRASGLVGGPYAFAWSADGTRILGGIGGEDYWRIAVIDPVTGGVTVLLPGLDTNPVGLSHDGLTIAFQPATETNTAPLRLMGIDGTGVRTLVRSVFVPSFTADWQP